MYKYIKNVKYYYNNSFLEQHEIEKVSFPTLESAKNYLNNTTLKFYYNKKYYSCYESAEVWEKTQTGYRIYNKSINIKNGKEEKNF